MTITIFPGFLNTKTRLVQLPAEVFTDLVPLIDDLNELRLTLFALWALQQKDRDDYRYLRREDFMQPEVSAMHGLTGADFDAALKRCVERETLLCAEVLLGSEHEPLYFANSPAGRAAVRQVRANAWLPGDLENPIQILPERPTVYKLYEDNIGSLTPLIADDLKDTAAEYGTDWLEEAIHVSVQMNKRSLRYVRAILESWRREGKHNSYNSYNKHQPQGQHEAATGQPPEHEQRSLTGKYADFFER